MNFADDHFFKKPGNFGEFDSYREIGKISGKCRGEGGILSGNNYLLLNDR